MVSVNMRTLGLSSNVGSVNPNSVVWEEEGTYRSALLSTSTLPLLTAVWVVVVTFPSPVLHYIPVLLYRMPRPITAPE